MMEKLSSLSVVFPAYNDAQTIGLLVTNVNKLLPNITGTYEIVVVNDGSTDKTLQKLQSTKREIPELQIVTHKDNRGYGAALMSGFKKARYHYIFYTDGDGQYDVSELQKLADVLDDTTDMVTGFKINRSDPLFRKIIGAVYNQFVKKVFNIHVRDIDCDFRLFKKSILEGVNLPVTSGAFDAIFIKKLQDKNVRFKEVGVHHFSRPYGHSQFFNIKHIAKSIWDLVHFMYAH